MRALITGITGQDGSYLTDRLVEEGAEVHGLVRAADSGATELRLRHPGVVLHEGDLSDLDGLRRLVVDVAPDELYNLAGISSVAQSWREPALTGLVTGVAVAALLDATATIPGIRVVQASSSEIFGEPDQVPQTESTTIAPTSPYGVAKAYAHRMAELARRRGTFVATAILYNHESPRRPETFVTRKITAAAVRIAAGLQVDLELGDLDVARDWGWAPDYVDAMVRMIRADHPDEFIIATGESHTVREFVATAFEAAGLLDWEPHVRSNPAFFRSGEISHMRGDASRAREVLGWAPTETFAGLVARMVEADQTATGTRHAG